MGQTAIRGANELGVTAPAMIVRKETVVEAASSSSSSSSSSSDVVGKKWWIERYLWWMGKWKEMILL